MVLHGLLKEDQPQLQDLRTEKTFGRVPANHNNSVLQDDIFLQPTKMRVAVTCTTQEISSLNSREADNRQDLLLMTQDRIREVPEVTRSHYDTMAAICDAVALLDVCYCFADNVTLSPNRGVDNRSWEIAVMMMMSMMVVWL